ncbi:hypothetical protein A0U87_04065 [Sphingobium sp. MP9-4]|nr:hypothetical protein A0U87_04065 [Sphingobium sp. MP9-4]
MIEPCLIVAWLGWRNGIAVSVSGYAMFFGAFSDAKFMIEWQASISAPGFIAILFLITMMW